MNDLAVLSDNILALQSKVGHVNKAIKELMAARERLLQCSTEELTYVRFKTVGSNQWNKWHVLLYTVGKQMLVQNARSAELMNSRTNSYQAVEGPIGVKYMIIAKSAPDRKLAQTLLTELYQQKIDKATKDSTT